MGWFFKDKEVCSHCNVQKTRRKDESGKPLCSVCKIQKTMDAEAKIKCPYDGVLMEKEMIEDTDIIIDRCPVCKGVWLDPNELELLAETMDESGSNFATGLCVGIAIG